MYKIFILQNTELGSQKYFVHGLHYYMKLQTIT